MIGIFDYTVVLTYLSLASAALGSIIALTGNGHPYIGAFFLLFCGLCDAFDGKVARTKKDRTDRGRKFGIQIDSLSDVVAFGVLPACIGYAAMNTSPLFSGIFPRASEVAPPAIFKELFGNIPWYFIVLKIALIAAIAVGAFILGWNLLEPLFKGGNSGSVSVAASAGVTESLYTQGMDMIHEHASDDYIQNLQTVYRTPWTPLITQMPHAVVFRKAVGIAGEPRDGLNMPALPIR